MVRAAHNDPFAIRGIVLATLYSIDSKGHHDLTIRPMRIAVAHLLVTVLLLLAVVGCTSNPQKSSVKTAQRSAAAMYESGHRALVEGDYAAASAEFQSLEVDYPDTQYLDQAEMELAYAYLQTKEYSATIATVERFLRRNPEHVHADYLYYLRALANYQQAVTALTSTDTPIDTAPPAAMMALQNFADLLARYPDSKYSADARERSTHLKQRLAEMALVSAKDRLSQGDYEAAALGASAIRQDFPDSTVVAEALTVEKMARHMLGTNSDDEGTVDGGVSSATPVGAVAATPDTTAQSTTTTKAEGMAGEESVAGDRPRMDAPGSLRAEAWINAQNPAAYTIQVMSSANRRSLVGFAKRYGLESEVAYFETRRKGKPWHVAVYGSYDTVTAARAALGNLPEDVRRRRPWIRNMSDVQAAITLTALESQNAAASGE